MCLQKGLPKFFSRKKSATHKKVARMFNQEFYEISRILQPSKMSRKMPGVGWMTFRLSARPVNPFFRYSNDEAYAVEGDNEDHTLRAKTERIYAFANLRKWFFREKALHSLRLEPGTSCSSVRRLINCTTSDVSFDLRNARSLKFTC